MIKGLRLYLQRALEALKVRPLLEQASSNLTSIVQEVDPKEVEGWLVGPVSKSNCWIHESLWIHDGGENLNTFLLEFLRMSGHFIGSWVHSPNQTPPQNIQQSPTKEPVMALHFSLTRVAATRSPSGSASGVSVELLPDWNLNQHFRISASTWRWHTRQGWKWGDWHRHQAISRTES